MIYTDIENLYHRNLFLVFLSFNLNYILDTLIKILNLMIIFNIFLFLFILSIYNEIFKYIFISSIIIILIQRLIINNKNLSFLTYIYFFNFKR